MSCGGKLEELLPKAEKKPSPAPVEAAAAPELEFDDGIPRGNSDIDETAAKKPKEESYFEIDLGIEAPPEDEDPGEKTLEVKTEPVRKTRTTIEIKIDDEPKPQQSAPSLDLNFEKQVLEQHKKQKERQARTTLESIESEKSATDFITKWETPKETAKEVIKETKKKPEKTSSAPDFDELFSELTSFTNAVTRKSAKAQSKPAEKTDVLFQNEGPKETKAAYSEDIALEIEPDEEDLDKTMPVSLEIETDKEDDTEKNVPISLEIETEAAQTTEQTGQASPETGEFSENEETETAGTAEETADDGEFPIIMQTEERAKTAETENTVPESSQVFIRNASNYKLNPRRVNETYDVSFDRLIAETVTEEFKDSCIPMLRKIEQNFRICKGGLFFLRGKSGIGKSRFYGNMKTFSEKPENPDSETFSLVVSDVNLFDFDFMIFINLIKKLMKITACNPAEISEKFNSLFGDALPDNKKDCLNALICLNFVPIKTKLPKHDLEYLIAYVVYCLSRNKPVLWIVNNANLLNVRTVKFLSNLKSLFDYAPMAVVCTVDDDAAILAEAEPENIYDFKGLAEEKLAKAVFSTVGTNRIPADMEKLLHEKAGGNMLFAMQLTEYLKDLGLIFDMKGSWRFAKLPDDFNCPEGIDELVAKRAELLSEDLALTLREFTLLNLYSVPRNFFSLVSTTGSECVDELIKKGFLAPDGDSVRFAARAVMTALKKMIKIGKPERTFYRNTVDKLISTDSEIASINKHWLLLSYINSGGIVDKKMNSFLFSSAVYMEKLGFFEISQRSYQTIISSFEADDTEDDFRILPEIKNARLWKIVEPQWAKIFWEKLLTYAKQHFDYHLELLAKSEILLLDEKNINLTSVADIIKKFHTAGCYEDEFRLIDKTTDILIGNGEHLEANTFAVRGYKLLRDVIVKSDGKGVRPAEFIYILYIRSACKLAEICMMLQNYVQATEILEETLNYADKFGASYFKSKIMFLLGKIRMKNNEEWEDLIQEGFTNALIGMDFSILKAFLRFFEENGLENRDWVEPFLEYKNCMNF